MPQNKGPGPPKSEPGGDADRELPLLPVLVAAVRSVDQRRLEFGPLPEHRTAIREEPPEERFILPVRERHATRLIVREVHTYPAFKASPKELTRHRCRHGVVVDHVAQVRRRGNRGVADGGRPQPAFVDGVLGGKPQEQINTAIPAGLRILEETRADRRAQLDPVPQMSTVS